MSKGYNLLGDVVLVQHLQKNIQSSVLHIPETVRSKAGGIVAQVIDYGFVPHERRKHGKHKNKKFFVGDVLASYEHESGDLPLVVVPEHFGTRGLFPEYPEFILYDGEDVLAIVES